MGTGHDHQHRPPLSASARHVGRLKVVFAMVATFTVVEALGGWLTRSLALLSDAGHMLTDALGLGMALAAILAAARADADETRTYGLYRLEILAALANAVLLIGVAVWVLWEAVDRLRHPPEILAGPMFVVATLGLVVNVVSFLLLRRGAAESLNLRGAMLEVFADLLGSVAATIAALVIRFTGWTTIDPILGAALGLFILPRAFDLGREAIRVLVQAAPAHVDVEALRRDLESIPGVVDVHDLHVWTLTSDMDVATVHLMAESEDIMHRVLDRARHVMEAHHGLAHATLQVEPVTHQGCEKVRW